MGSAEGDIWSVTAAQSYAVVHLPPLPTKDMEIKVSFSTMSLTDPCRWPLSWVSLLRALGFTVKKKSVSISKPASGPGSLKTWAPLHRIASRMDGQSRAESHGEGPGKRHSTRADEGQPP